MVRPRVRRVEKIGTFASSPIGDASAADTAAASPDVEEVGETSEPQGETLSFGQYLARARETKGLTLDDLAHSTKIRRAILEAVEHNTRGDLPEKVFVLGYVRSYAIAVGLNVEDTYRRFQASWVDDAQAVAEEEAKASGRSFSWLGPAIAALIALLAVWLILKGL
jgi:transcriptional regulator with XRE-family HTH domain